MELSFLREFYQRKIKSVSQLVNDEHLNPKFESLWKSLGQSWALKILKISKLTSILYFTSFSSKKQKLNSYKN